MKIAKIDRLGRIVIPIHDRRALNLSEGSPVEVRRQGERIILSPYVETCRLCGAEIEEGQSVKLCPPCIGMIKLL